VLKTSREWEKDCGEPGCPNDHRSQLERLRRSDRMSATSVVGTFRTCRDNLSMSAPGGKADIPPQGRDFRF
jgi:hypothetical protein